MSSALRGLYDSAVGMKMVFGVPLERLSASSSTSYVLSGYASVYMRKPHQEISPQAIPPKSDMCAYPSYIEVGSGLDNSYSIAYRGPAYMFVSP